MPTSLRHPPPTFKERIRRIRPAMSLKLLGLAMLVAGCVVGLSVVSWPPRFVLRNWAASIEQMDDVSAVEAIDGLTKKGDAGLRVLAMVLAFQRKPLVEAAYDTLMEEMILWGRLPPDRAAERLALLAEALADEAPRYGPAGRQAAGDMVELILKWPALENAPSHAALVAASERLLSILGPESEMLATKVVQPPLSLSRGNGATTGSIGLDQAPLSGGGLPVELSNPPEGHTWPIPRSAENEPPAVIASEVGRPREAPPEEGFTLTPPQGPVEAELSNPPELIAPGLLVNQLPLDVMRELHASTPQRRAEAHAELLRRKFSELEIAIARRLTDADPTVRAMLATGLLNIAGVDPNPWLLWLCRDDNANVRYTALSLIATSNDLAVLREVEQLARQDADLRVVELAEQIWLRRQEMQQ